MGRAGRQLKLSGVFAGAVTPNRPGTPDVDYSALMDQLDFLAAAGVTGVCVMGPVGEFLNYPFAERQRAIYLGAKRSRVPLLVGVSHSTIDGALQLAGEAISAGADGLLLIPPYFFPYDQREVAEFCRVFAEETGDAVPIVLENAPQITSPIEFATARMLLGTGLFAGFADAGGDWSFFESLLELRRSLPFALLSANDRLALPAILAGADALLSDCAAAVPELVASLWKTRSQEADRKLREFVAWTERFPTPVAIKRAVELRGQKAGTFAVPFSEDRKQELEEFSRWFRAWM